MHSPAMRAAGAARVAPSAAAARPRTSAGKGRGVAPPCAATKRTSPEAAQNELAALKRQVQQAEQLISAGKLAEAEQILGCERSAATREAVCQGVLLRVPPPLTCACAGLRSFIVPTMSIDNSRAGRNPVKSAGVIWGVLATESSVAQSPPQGGAAAPAVASAAAPPAAQDEPAVSDEELLSSALIVPAVAMDISRPPPSESFTAWLLQSDEAIAAVKAKALKARRDGTDPADAFSDANGACAARCAVAQTASRPNTHHAHSGAEPRAAALRGQRTEPLPPAGLVTYIASLSRDEQLEMEPDLRYEARLQRRVGPCVPRIAPLTPPARRGVQCRDGGAAARGRRGARGERCRP